MSEPDQAGGPEERDRVFQRLAVVVIVLTLPTAGVLWLALFFSQGFNECAFQGVGCVPGATTVSVVALLVSLIVPGAAAAVPKETMLKHQWLRPSALGVQFAAYLVMAFAIAIKA